MEIPFKNYFSYSGDLANGAVPFNVASQSIDRMWGLTRLDDYVTNDNTAKHLAVTDYVEAKDLVAHTPAETDGSAGRRMR